ncbi:MAG: ImmA/IrrE family metallo-endopeptidase [Nitrospiraceae bacterium]|nr:ImmA/IrrE family metallo-endopeptidase [Nitrospiraceae bacterium]
MRRLGESVLSFIHWLRKPQRFIHKLQALTANQTLPRLNQLDELALYYGIEVAEMPLNSGVEGMATYVDGQPVILLRSDLTPFNRQFVLAHEMAHIQLHLTAATGREVFMSYVPGGDVDVEADTYAILCMMESLPPERVVTDGIKYVITNRNMTRRAWRVILYFSGYRLRIMLAQLIERTLLSPMVKGAI